MAEDEINEAEVAGEMKDHFVLNMKTLKGVLRRIPFVSVVCVFSFVLKFAYFLCVNRKCLFHFEIVCGVYVCRLQTSSC